MNIFTQFGNQVRLIGRRKGRPQVVWVRRVSDGALREIPFYELRADGGINAIQSAVAVLPTMAPKKANATP